MHVKELNISHSENIQFGRLKCIEMINRASWMMITRGQRHTRIENNRKQKTKKKSFSIMKWQNKKEKAQFMRDDPGSPFGVTKV